MSYAAIRVHDLGKRFRIGEQERYRTLRDSFTRLFHASFNHRSHQNGKTAGPNGDSNHIWALRDISFEVEHGEVVGIIGRNGAGKSTLLKILSRITEPTTGYAQFQGRLGSLLEVGIGFHPEMTGRENIYLNGAIIGMKRAEIKRKFDEMVAFAEIERFIDTPVKRYSSGMYMRLAFAVVAHLETEILMVDEVLAVGDAAFQKKCLGKMGQVASEGRTVLFVSHNMLAVQNLCNRTIWLDGGQIKEEGRSAEVISRYLQTSFSQLTEQRWDDFAAAPGNDSVRVRRASVRPVDGSPSDPITVRTPIVMEFEYWNLVPGAYLSLSWHLYNEQGILVFGGGPTHEPNWLGRPYPIGLFRDACFIPGDLLNDGLHRLELHIVRDQGTVIYRQDDILVFDVQDTAEMRDAWFGKWTGAVRPILDWSTDLIDDSLPHPATIENHAVLS